MQDRSLRWVLAFLVPVLAGCSAQAASDVDDARDGDAVQAGALTLEGLKNAEYLVPYGGGDRVRLEDGRADLELGGSVGVTEPVAFGDLDGDGLNDAVLSYGWSEGGQAVHGGIAVVLNRDGEPLHLQTLTTGPDSESMFEPQLDALSIEGRTVTAVWRVHGPDDARCCPSEEETTTHVLGLTSPDAQMPLRP